MEQDENHSKNLVTPPSRHLKSPSVTQIQPSNSMGLAKDISSRANLSQIGGQGKQANTLITDKPKLLLNETTTASVHQPFSTQIVEEGAPNEIVVPYFY